MRIAVVFCLLAVAACVYAEQCTVNGDCASTVCATGNHVVCEHKNEDGATTNGGLCTCAKNDLTCTTKDDCIAIDFQCQSDRRKHCYDNKCICSRW